jgi:XTP/dITP diphosphohydrolase
MDQYKPTELLIATHNLGKLQEVAELLAGLPLNLRSLPDFDEIEEVEETGETFAANAELKAAYYAERTGLWAFSDDSGLQVKALNWGPGVFSARHAGETATSEQRNEKVLRELGDTKDNERVARYVCVVSLADPSGNIVRSEVATCDGRIASESRGSNGFGYDSIFIPEGYDQTFGELPNSIKSRISHRARASRQMVDFLLNFLKN